MLFIRLLDYLHCNPHTGAIASITGWFLGSCPFMQVQAHPYNDQIIFYLQIVSLVIGSVAGVLTIISLLTRKKKRCK